MSASGLAESHRSALARWECAYVDEAVAGIGQSIELAGNPPAAAGLVAELCVKSGWVPSLSFSFGATISEVPRRIGATLHQIMYLLTHLPPGWVEIGPTEQERFEDEYAAEIAKGHPLYGVPVRAIARRTDRDDVLFKVLRHLCDYAVVQLTWSRGEEQPPDMPRFDLYTDDADLISELGKREAGTQ